MNTHFFTTTESAYAACQCDENVRAGDILVIVPENVIGVAQCWPVAVTKEYGGLHTIEDGHTPQAVLNLTQAQVNAAVECAWNCDFPVSRTWENAYRSEIS